MDFERFTETKRKETGTEVQRRGQGLRSRSKYVKSILVQ